MQTEDYLKTRVDEQIVWMEGKSRRNQQLYKLLKALEIIAAAIIPFLAGFHDQNKAFPLITGLLGIFIVVLSGLQQLYKYHENWITYRTTIEALKREKILYLSGTDPYNNGDAYHRFVQNFEALLADENKVWKENWVQKAEQA